MNVEWNTTNYLNNFSYISEYGKQMINLLTVLPGSQILDLSCGTGGLTNVLKTPGYQVISIDTAKEQLALVRKSFSKIAFIQADAVIFK